MPKNKTFKRKLSVKKVFTDNDYESGDGMLTKIWGPCQWHFLHTMSFNYPTNPTEEQKKQYMRYINDLKHVLPCGKCRINLSRNLSKLPLRISDMKSRYTFSLYIYKLHEIVNKMLGKNSGLSYEDVRERYEHFRARCTKSIKSIKCVALVNKTLRKQLGKHEKGCVQPLYGEKSKCVLKIIPDDEKCETLEIDKKCIKQRL